MSSHVVDSLLAELRAVIRELGQDGRLIGPSIYDTACCPLRASSGSNHVFSARTSCSWA